MSENAAPFRTQLQGVLEGTLAWHIRRWATMRVRDDGPPPPAPAPIPFTIAAGSTPGPTTAERHLRDLAFELFVDDHFEDICDRAEERVLSVSPLTPKMVRVARIMWGRDEHARDRLDCLDRAFRIMARRGHREDP